MPQFVLGSNLIVETKHNNLAYLRLLTTTIKIESKVIKNYQ
jgi:hypothetical protein